MTEAIKNEPATKHTRRMARTPKIEVTENTASAANAAPVTPLPSAKPDKPQSKSALVLELLVRPEGATIDQLIAATGWLPHTTRAALTGFKKKGHVLSSEKPAERARVYRVTGKLETV